MLMFMALMACLLPVGAVFGATAESAHQMSVAAVELAAQLERYQSLSFNFRQQISNEVEDYFEETKGRAYLQRPNKVHWQTTHPYSQLIVSDGRIVWLYDPDLLQAIRKNFNSNPVEAPALLLLSDIDTLVAHFEVQSLGVRDKIKWFLLLPKTENIPVKLIEIGFKGKQLQRFLIEDHHLQRSLFIFESLRTNPKIAAKRFQFVPPPGTDIADEVIGVTP